MNISYKHLFIITLFVTLFSSYSNAQNLPVKWEELTSPDFSTAVKQSSGVCIIPMGVLEKHGPHMPLGTDVFVARDVAERAAMKDYVIVYPFYHFGQIFEAKHQPGTVAYSQDLLYKILDETCQEISRNGIKKIILYSYHGGNNFFLKYFCQAQLSEKHDYVVYLATTDIDEDAQKKIDKLLVDKTGGHADEGEASEVMYIKPGLTKIEHANDESGKSLDRLLPLKGFFTGIWWYARFPNHYAGNAAAANEKLGEFIINCRVNDLVKMIKEVKNDTTALQLQNEFYNRTIH